MKKRTAALMLVISMSLCLAAACRAESAESPANDPYQKAKVAARETLWKAITNGQGSGATVAVMDNGEIVYSEGIGVRDRAQNSPVDRHTRFNIGSTSKMFVCTAVLLLVDEGKVGLDEKVTRYIPGFTMKDERYKDITVRMLFNHSSGLPGSTFYFSYRPSHDMHEILLKTLADASLKHRPGAMSMYCNDAFTLAEIIVEKVSGRKYLKFLQERIFTPLGMHDTGASIGEYKGADRAEYYDAKTGKKYPPEVVTVYAAGGLSSTAEDLCRFGSSFTAKGSRILSEASLREIRSTQPTHFSGRLKSRQMMSELGWEYTRLHPFDRKGIQVMGKGGNTMCYSTNLQIVPDQGIVIGLSLSGHANGEALTRPILDAVMEEKQLVEPETKRASKPPSPQQIPPELSKYAGFYADEDKVVKLIIDRKGRKIDLCLPAAEKKAGAPWSEPLLSFIYHDGYLYNTENELQCYLTTIEGKRYLARHRIPSYGVDMLLFQKLEPVKRPKALKAPVDGKIWLMRNVRPYVQAGTVGLITSALYKDFPGYADFCGIKKIEGPGSAAIAATCFRDQTAVALMNRNGEWWARAGMYLLSEADRAKKAARGVNTVTIGADGYNEWLNVAKGAILSFEKPEEGRVIVVSDDKVLFDSVVDRDELYAPEGSFVFCAAPPGGIFKIRAR
ncbi:MAG: serine hydrolase domain-containing protein [Candidatus Eremiobacteraeota bacterium]|nr:serine hydrolase domain-containing protein [Candidatus Eremiobacteraeota bacterium]